MHTGTQLRGARASSSITPRLGDNLEAERLSSRFVCVRLLVCVCVCVRVKCVGGSRCCVQSMPCHFPLSITVTSLFFSPPFANKMHYAGDLCVSFS